MIDPSCGGVLRWSQKNFDSHSTPTSTKESKARVESGFVVALGEVETEQKRCERSCRGELYLTLYDWKQCQELRHRAEKRYNLVDCVLVLRTSMVRDDEHMQIIDGLGSVITRMWMDPGRLKELYRQSVKMRLTDAAMRVGRGILPVREGEAGSRAGSLLHHVKKVRDGRENARE